VTATSPVSFRAHVACIALITGVVFLMFWRVVFLGQTLVDVAALNNQLPWGYSAGPSSYPYNRRDLTDTYVTRDYFVVAAYRDGEAPLWNPYTMAGHPIYADGVTRVASPFLLFYKFFDIPLGYSIARITELLLGAIFMYGFLITLGAGPPGGLMGALVFAFSAHSMLHLTGLGWWGGLMWLPLIFLFIERATSRQRYNWAILAGIILGAQFFCGYLPNQAYYPGAIILAYVFFAYRQSRAAHGRAERWRAYRRGVGMAAVTLLIGFGLGATQWAPMLELLKYSNRRIIGAELGYIYLPPWYAATMFFPNMFGAAYDATALRLFTALGVSHDHILYIGIAALLPLGFVIYARKQVEDGKRRDQIIFFLLLAGVALVLMMAAPLYVRVTRFIPLMQVIRVAVRAGVLFLFAASALVGLGVDLLLRSRTDAVKGFLRIAKRWIAAVGAGLGLVAQSCWIARYTGFAVDQAGSGRLAFARRSAAFLAFQFFRFDPAILIPLALVIGVFWLTRQWAAGRLRREAFLFVLVGLLVADLFWNSGQFNSTFERSRVFPRTQITDLLRTLPAGRVLVTPSDIETNRKAVEETGAQKIIAPPNTLLAYQVPTVTGKNQQFPKWYREFAELIEPQPYMSHVVFDRSQSPLFDLLNVRYIMTHDAAAPLPGCELLRSAEGVSLYENPKVLPRAFAIERALEVTTHEAALDALKAPGFDPRNLAVIETEREQTERAAREKRSLLPPAEAPQGGPARGETGDAAIVEDKRDRVRVECDLAHDAIIVLSDNYYPGWRADIDGQPVDVLRANITMRAVRAPAGHHLITFVFAPGILRLSAYASIASGLAAATGLIVLWARGTGTPGPEGGGHALRQD